jgi:hypothetical protein
MRCPALAVTLLSLVIVRGARADEPVPPAVQVDLDGDGAIDRLERAGDALVVTTAHGATRVALGGAIGQLAGGGRLIVAEVTGSAGREAVIVGWRGGAPVVAWRGPVGPVGADGDYAIAVEASAAGVVRVQRRAGIDRCDGAAAQLFAEGWDAAQQRFRPILPAIGVDPHAPVITATATAPTGAPARSAVFHATAASSMAGASDASELTAPRALDDGDPATRWREDRGGDGRGEFFTFRAGLAGTTAVGLRIVPGSATDPATRGTNRIARLAVVAGHDAYWIDVPEVRGAADQALWATLPPIAGGCVTVIVAAVHRGAGAPAGGGETVIGDLAVLGAIDVAPGGAVTALAAAVAAGGADGATAARELGRRGADGTQALLARLATTTEVASRRRLLAALATGGDPAAAAALGVAITRGELRGVDAATAAHALAGLGADGARALAAIATQATDDDTRAIAITGLGVIAAPAPGHEVALDALVGLAGAPTRAVRAAVIDALVQHGAPALLARAAATGAPDLWWAAARAATAPADLAAVRAGLRAALTATASYELRYRAIAVLGWRGDADDVAAATAAIAALDQAGAAAPALRQVLARGLAQNSSVAAARALTALIADPDPGVRGAVIAALADGHADTGSPWAPADADELRDRGDRALGTALATDTWPEVRHAAAAALGARCQRPGPAAALGDAVDRDADVAVRGDALAGLVACRAAGVAARLWQVADDRGAPGDLRLRAVALIGALGDRALAPDLATRFARWREAAFSDELALALATHAAVVLGHLGDRSATAGLADAAQDAAFPALQAAAVEALGELGECAAATRKIYDQLATSAERAVVLAAQRARAACAR